MGRRHRYRGTGKRTSLFSPPKRTLPCVAAVPPSHGSCRWGAVRRHHGGQRQNKNDEREIDGKWAECFALSAGWGQEMPAAGA